MAHCHLLRFALLFYITLINFTQCNLCQILPSNGQVILSGARHDDAREELGPRTDEHTFSLQSTFFRSVVNDSRPLQILKFPKSTPSSSATFLTNSKAPKSLDLRSRPISIQKRAWKSKSEAVEAAFGRVHWSEWLTTQISGPNVTDRTTLINLAKMTSDAYYSDPSQPGWFNISGGFNHSNNFGWQEDGLRGHVFADATNETLVIAFKGTSIDPREKWSTNDRLNDNLLFSCCCATQRPDPYWYGQVCDCRTETYKCNSTCLTQELTRKDRYYRAAIEVYRNVTMMHPGSQIWMVGHSMGGAMASLIGLAFNVPAVTFESLPQKLPAQRLGLQVAPDPRLTGAFHFGHSADPVFMGACNGYFSSCSVAGFAFESQCFTGMRCEYDTVGDKGWTMSINTHRINNVIPYVLEAYDTVANCTLDEECAECNNWYFDVDPEPSALR